MGEPGYASWPDDGGAPYQFDQMYVAGTWVPHVPGLRKEPGPGCWALPTAGGTHKFQRPYRGEFKPKDLRVNRFSFQVQADSRLVWDALQRARARCAPFYFATGQRQTDCFPAVDGETYRLTSPLAIGIVPGIADPPYLTVVEMDGVEDPGAAAVAGQNVVAAATGEICVSYSPVHRVHIVTFSESVNEHNNAVLDIVLDELLVS